MEEDDITEEAVEMAVTTDNKMSLKRAEAETVLNISSDTAYQRSNSLKKETIQNSSSTCTISTLDE